MAKRGRPPKNPSKATAQAHAKPRAEPRAETYRHPEAESLLRPEVGTQPQFRKKKPPASYRYDSSLSPAVDWDGRNPAREQGEALIREILGAKSLPDAKAAAARLKALGRPFLIVRLKREPAVHVILETKGFDPLEEVKAQAAERWVAAVNADRVHGKWAHAVVRKPGETREVLDRVGES